MILGFGINVPEKPSPSGHAVALLKHSIRNSIFFDPNYGIWVYNLEGARCALQYLFGNLPSRQGRPIYGEDGNVVNGEVGYTVYAKAH